MDGKKCVGDTMHEASCIDPGLSFISSMANELAKCLFGQDFHGNKKAVLYWKTFPSLGVLENWCAL